MTLRQCEKKAGKYLDFNRCDEYEKAYVFYADDGDEYTGGNSCVVIIKETGRAMTFEQFVLEFHPEKEPISQELYLCGGIKLPDPYESEKKKNKLL